MQTKKRKHITKIISLICLSLVFVCSIALFTDRATSSDEHTAESLGLVLSESWAETNEETSKTFAPGDILDLTYSLENKGTLDAKVRETFVVTTDKVVTDEFDIYLAEDVTQNAETGVWETDADPIEVRSIKAWGEGTKITYEIPEHILATETEEEYKLVLLFSKYAGNTIQGASLKIEYLGQAIQDKNTASTDWEDAAVVSDELTIGGEIRDVVPGDDLSSGGSGGSGSGGSTQVECPIYFGETYSCSWTENTTTYVYSYIFYENGSAKFIYYANGVKLGEQELPAGSAIYDELTINLYDSGEIVGTATVSANGKTIDMGEGMVLTLEEVIETPLKFGETYSWKETVNGSEECQSYVFYEDGSATVFFITNGEIKSKSEMPAGSAFYDGLTIYLYDSGEIVGTITISVDGKTLYFDGHKLVLEE